MISASWKNWLCKALPALLCIILYAQTLGFDYVWDDGIIFLEKNSLIVEPLSWKLLAQPVLETTTYMRPFVLLTWWLEFRIFGQLSVVSHGLNVLIFILNVQLLRLLAKRVLCLLNKENPEWWSVVAASIYAVHPALIEATAWVSGRFDLLCTTGILATTLIFLNKQISLFWRTAGVVICTTLAVFSKELGVVTPAILFCLWMAVYAKIEQSFFKNAIQVLRDERIVWFALGLLLIFYFAVRAQTMGGIYHSPWSLEYFLQIIKNMLPLEALKFYIGLAFWPFGKVGIVHPATSLQMNVSSLIENILVVFLTLGIFWKALFKNKAWAWISICSYILIALVLHFIPLTINENYAQDRFLTAPLAFICIAIVLFPWREIFQDKLKIRVEVSNLAAISMLGGWIAFAIFVCLTLIPMWGNSAYLWRWASQQYPDIPTVRYNYLEAAMTHNRENWFLEEITRLKNRNGGLEVGEQIIYGNYLLGKGNPESVKYIEGALYAIPKFHEMENGRELLKYFPLSPAQIGGAYFTYATAKLLFEKDATAALDSNRAAMWYIPEGGRGTIVYQRAAILYISGDMAGGDSIVEKYRNVYFFNKKYIIDGMLNMVNIFCEKERKDAKDYVSACDEFKRKNFLSSQ